MTELANIQKWLTSIIVKPGNVNDKILMADQHYGLNHNEVIRPAVNMSQGQKIGIYARGYVLRLMECMQAEYPTLKYLLGTDLFETFVKAYLVQMPPSSPDLYDLGANFAAFLKASQPKSANDSNMFDLPIELAILERALAKVSRCKGLERTVQENTIDAVLYMFDTTAITTSPCLQLLDLKFPLPGFVKAVQQGLDVATPVIGQARVAISRKDYIVHMHEVEAWQWQFLKALQSTGNYMNAVNAAAAECSIENSAVLADLVLWIPLAIKFGYIYRDGDDLSK